VCGFGVEDVLYILRDCPAVRDIWNKLIPTDKLSNFYSIPPYEWMARIWKNRNLYIFQNYSWNTEDIIKVSISWARQFTSASISFKHGYRSLIARLDPTRNCVHLTTDGSVRTEDGLKAVIAIQDVSLEDSNSTLVRRIHQLLD
ncbi:hypothetical protein Golob_025853, partial [Gossypium lobatum]|nr:hypothetical protein [Gossypium lobatum]